MFSNVGDLLRMKTFGPALIERHTCWKKLYEKKPQYYMRISVFTLTKMHLEELGKWFCCPAIKIERISCKLLIKFFTSKCEMLDI